MVLVDGPVQACLVIFALDVNVGVFLDQSFHYRLVTALA
jgi:hypothetical protein